MVSGSDAGLGGGIDDGWDVAEVCEVVIGFAGSGPSHARGVVGLVGFSLARVGVSCVRRR
jgi:hypothetical protein